jgi:hypothetical protein
VGVEEEASKMQTIITLYNSLSEAGKDYIKGRIGDGV